MFGGVAKTDSAEMIRTSVVSQVSRILDFIVLLASEAHPELRRADRKIMDRKIKSVLVARQMLVRIDS
jgi:hypothetical protein